MGKARYAFSMVRSFGVRGKLLARRNVEDLCASANLEDFVNSLRNTAYELQLSKLQKPYNAPRIEASFRERLVQTHYDMIRSVIDVTGSALIAAYYDAYLMRNLKTILRGKASGTPSEELTGLITLFAEELVGRRNIIVEAIAARTLAEAVETLRGSEFGEECGVALSEYNATKNINVFDAHLDKAFYASVFKAFNYLSPSEKKSASTLVLLDMDAYNVLAILRSKLWGLTPSQTRALLVETRAGVTSDMLSMMITAEAVREAIQVLKDTRYQNLVSGVTYSTDVGVISDLERAFRIASYQEAAKFFTWEPLSTGIAMAAIRLLEAEVNNLAVIAYGVETRAKAGVTASKLILV